MRHHDNDRRSARQRVTAIGLGLLVGLGATGTAGAGLAAANDLCGSLQSIVVPGGEVLCTHGDDRHLLDLAAAVLADEVLDGADDALEAVSDAIDAPSLATALDAPVLGALGSTSVSPAPRGEDEAVAAAEQRSNRVDAAVPSLPPLCLGDGTDGARVQVVAVDVRGSGVAPASDADLRRWAGQVEWTFVTSAERDGGSRNVRWATRGADGGCELAIARLTVDPADVDGFQATVTTLAEAGFARPDHKYLAFVADDAMCGLGTVPLDDTAGFDNAANHRVGYSRIDAPCWDSADTGWYSVAAHELSHNLGAVQASAPHSNGSHHCTDEWDLMCYAEGEQDVTVACRDDVRETEGEGDHNNRLLDCGGDDYFNAADDVTGYLGQHWNIAHAQHLHGAPQPPAEPEPAPKQAEPAPQDPEEEDEDEAQLLPTLLPPPGPTAAPASRLATAVLDWLLELVTALGRA